MKIVGANYYFHAGFDARSYDYRVTLAWNRRDLLGHKVDLGDFPYLDRKDVIIASKHDVVVLGWIRAIRLRIKHRHWW